MFHPILQKKPVAIALLVLTASFGVAAQTTAGSTSTATGATPKSATATADANSSKSIPSGDRKFVEEVAKGGLAEVELAKLAQQKASSDQVKQFASRMDQDHSKANDELKQIASSKGIQVPTEMDKSHKKELDRLGKLSGAEFDREYMKHMVSDHKKDVSAFEKEAKSGKDSDVKGFADKTLPTLQDHLKLAQSVNDAVKSSKGTMSGSGTQAPSAPKQ